MQSKLAKNISVEVGDIVLLIDDKGSHDSFPIARVVKTFKGPDGVVKSAEWRFLIKMKSTKITKKLDTKNDVNKLIYYPNKAKFIHRGVEKFALLEGNSSVDKKPENEFSQHFK